MWAAENGLNFRPQKTTVICSNTCNLLMNSVCIHEVQFTKDFGLIIRVDMSWNEHINMKYSHAIRSFQALKHNIPFNSTKHCKVATYISCVRSVLLFVSIIWYPSVMALSKMEKIQQRAVFWITSTRDYVSALISPESPTKMLSNISSRSQIFLKITAQQILF